VGNYDVAQYRKPVPGIGSELVVTYEWLKGCRKQLAEFGKDVQRSEM